MDLNYLFYRQQVERSMADAAKSKVARNAHEDLANRYETMIDDAVRPVSEEKVQPRLREDSSRSHKQGDSNVNAPLAVAMTAREVQGS